LSHLDEKDVVLETYIEIEDNTDKGSDLTDFNMNRQCPCVLKKISKLSPYWLMALVPQGEHRLIRIEVFRGLRRWSHFLCYNGVLQAVFVRDEASCDKLFFGSLRHPVSGLGSLELVFAQLDTRFGKSN